MRNLLIEPYSRYDVLSRYGVPLPWQLPAVLIRAILVARDRIAGRNCSVGVKCEQEIAHDCAHLPRFASATDFAYVCAGASSLFFEYLIALLFYLF